MNDKTFRRAAKAKRYDNLLYIRERYEQRRIKEARPHTVHFFYTKDDPYSELMNTLVTRLENDYNIELYIHTVEHPSLPFHEQSHKYPEYVLTDIRRLIQKYNITPTPLQTIPSTHSPELLDRLGHSVGGTVFYGEEWFKGIDRIHFLQQRLNECGAFKQTPVAPYVAPVSDDAYTNLSGTVQVFFNLRSIYSAIALKRLFKLSRNNSIHIDLKYTIPAAMRMKNPLTEFPAHWGQYASVDVAREASKYNLFISQFEERHRTVASREMFISSMALVDLAITLDLGEAFLESWIDAYYFEKRDLSQVEVLMRVAEQSGIERENAYYTHKHRLDIWSQVIQPRMQSNLRELNGCGLWGVPAFKYKDTVAWGQDRMWVVLDQMQESKTS